MDMKKILLVNLFCFLALLLGSTSCIKASVEPDIVGGFVEFLQSDDYVAGQTYGFKLRVPKMEEYRDFRGRVAVDTCVVEVVYDKELNNGLRVYNENGELMSSGRRVRLTRGGTHLFSFTQNKPGISAFTVLVEKNKAPFYSRYFKLDFYSKPKE